MKKLVIETTIKVFEENTDLPKKEYILLQKAVEALNQTYAPYSKFNVGAAVQLETGEILIAGNQENAAYPMCLCAERVALAAVHAQFPESKIESLAVVVKSGAKIIKEPASPCGACRQVLSEWEQKQNQPIRLIMQGEEGPVYILDSCSVLLPLGFGKNFLT